MTSNKQSQDWIDQLPEEIRAHVRKLAERPDFARQLAKFSGALEKLKKGDQEIPQLLALRARRAAPRDTRVRLDTEWAFRKMVPRWHYLIINNEERNELYRRAIETHVRPGMIVYEIGTGSGLLAMLAARAGARHVYTCEREPLMADAARENIARNGFADRLTVIGKDSKEVEVGADMPERADLMVCEIVDKGLLGEHALELTEDALNRLLKPDAILLPDEIELRGALVGGWDWMADFRTIKACGFDVSAIDWLGPVRSTLTRSLELRLSEEATLLRFEMARSAEYRKDKRERSLTVKEDGTVEGLVHWIWLRFGAGIEFCNRPPTTSCWDPIVHHFPEARPVKAGEQFVVGVKHDRRNVTIWPID